MAQVTASGAANLCCNRCHLAGRHAPQGTVQRHHEAMGLSILRYAIISDVHSNLPALEAVLKRLQGQSIDRYLCLGDTVGYGAFPNECCEMIRGLDPIIVRGNHDYAAVAPGQEEWFTPAARACILWTREQLEPANREFLAALEPYVNLDNAHLCHGALVEPDYYTTTPHEALLSFKLMDRPLCWFGHTHYMEWYAQTADHEVPMAHPAPEGAALRITEGVRYMINPGAVGQPRDGNSQAGYAVWDTDAAEISLERVPYNVRAAQDQMQQAGLPWNMAGRLSMGV